MKRAIYIKDTFDKTDYQHQSLYLLTDTGKYIIVSAVDLIKRAKAEALSKGLEDLTSHFIPNIPPETYIFESNIDGEIVSYSELDGSFRGSMDHYKALSNINYEIIYPNKLTEVKNRLDLITEE